MGLVISRTAAVTLLAVACAGVERAPAASSPGHLVGGTETEWLVPGYDDRNYLLRLPPDYDAESPIPVVFGFHGGGGNKEGFVRTGCPEGHRDEPGCLSALADREGFALVMPDGVRRRGLFGGRSWNAGGGRDGFRCVGGEACATDSDDVGYFDDLLAEVRRAVVVHDGRVYATGISNGGAMSHRLACERSEVVAAIATIAGAAQVQATPGCDPSRAIPVLHIHGTEDPCWGYDGSISERLCDDGTGGRFVSVPESMEGWLQRNGCDSADLDDMTREALPDTQDDGTRSTHLRGVDCAADTEHVRIDGGGHTWPSGWDYLAERRIGTVAQDFDGNQLVWAFLEAHPLPPTPIDID